MDKLFRLDNTACCEMLWKTCIRHKYTVCSIPRSFIPNINLLPCTIDIPRAHKRHCKGHCNRTSQWSINPKWANGQWKVCLIGVLPGTLAEVHDKIYDFKFYQFTHPAADFFSLVFFSIWTFSPYRVDFMLEKHRNIYLCFISIHNLRQIFSHWCFFSIWTFSPYRVDFMLEKHRNIYPHFFAHMAKFRWHRSSIKIPFEDRDQTILYSQDHGAKRVYIFK